MRRYLRKVVLLSVLLLVVATIQGVVGAPFASATPVVTTIAGTSTAGFSGDGGAATSAKVNDPTGVAVDGAGDVYIGDAGNHRIRKVDAAGTISTVAGDGTTNSSFTDPSDSIMGISSLVNGLASSDDGSTLLYSDGGINRTTVGGNTHHYAGKYTGFYGPYDDGPKYDTRINPTYVAYDDTTGIVYFAEQWDVREVTPDGQIKTVAGGINPGSTYSECTANAADGMAAVGACMNPTGIVAHDGKLYIGDDGYYNGGSRPGPQLWEIDESGILHHLMGGSCWCDSGIGGLATSASVSNIGAVAVSSTGEVYFSKPGDGTIRKVASNGTLQNVIDSGVPVGGLSFDRSDNLYVSGTSFHRVVKITNLYSPRTLSYVALGDSIASGEGINYGWYWNGTRWIQGGPDSPTWEPIDSPTSGQQNCHQSSSSYAQSVADKERYVLTQLGCTGASASEGVLDNEVFGAGQSWLQLGTSDSSGASPAAVYDDANPDVVTLTLGADDINFKDWVTTCYSPGSCDTTSNTSTLDSQLATAKTDLRKVLSELDYRAGLAGKEVRVLVTNYYNPFPDTYAECLDTSAGLLQGTYPGVGITAVDQAWLVYGLGELNSNISDEAIYAQGHDSNLDVSLVDISDVMLGHQFCNSDPWVYGPSIDYPAIGGGPNDNPASFHPTPAGQRAIADAVEAAIG